MGPGERFGEDRFSSSGRNSCINIMDYRCTSSVSWTRDRTPDHGVRTDNDGSNKKDSGGPYQVSRRTQTPPEPPETTHGLCGNVDPGLLVLRYGTDPKPDGAYICGNTMRGVSIADATTVGSRSLRTLSKSPPKSAKVGLFENRK